MCIFGPIKDLFFLFVFKIFCFFVVVNKHLDKEFSLFVQTIVYKIDIQRKTSLNLLLSEKKYRLAIVHRFFVTLLLYDTTLTGKIELCVIFNCNLYSKSCRTRSIKRHYPLTGHVGSGDGSSIVIIGRPSGG